jgi:pilus assembly protein FimV
MNRFAAAWVLAYCLWPACVAALGIGTLESRSALNEPFEARIELISATRDELDSLTVRLADGEAFRRAGIDRPYLLSALRFEVVERADGPDFIRVYSRDAIREPFLNFLLEIAWSKGRFFREYTVLLDPPLYDPDARRVAAPIVVPDAVYEAPAAPAAAAPADVTLPAYAGGDYGPTMASDTLWSIASRTRPDESVSVQQMMLALLRANPEAFADGNINALKRGQILRMPERDEITRLTPAEAMAEARRQHDAWAAARDIIAAAAPERPLAAETAAGIPAPAPAPAVEGRSELRLVAPSEDGGGTDQSGTGSAAAADGRASRDLALANEQLEALSQENLDLKQRLAEAESLVVDLRRLLDLKDDELATLQQHLAAGQDQEPAPFAAPGDEDTGEIPAAAMPDVEPAEEPEPEPEREPQPAKPVAAPQPAAAEPGLVERITGFVTGNLVMVAAAAGGLVVLVLAAMAMAARRRRSAENAEEMVAPEFPDFSGSEEETMLPGGESDMTDLRLDEEGRESAAVEAVPAAPVAVPAAREAAAPEAAAPAEEAQEDPLAEVNVFLAYEHFDQAEDFVRDAIRREPDNLDFHSKLLEVFYAAGDRRKYEEAARVLHDKVDGQGSHWDMALVMWQEMSPTRALFSAPAEGDEASAQAAAGGGMLDLTAEERSAAEPDIDFDLGDAEEQPAAADAAGEGEMLDITAGTDDSSALDLTAAGGEEDMLDVTAAVGLETDDSALEFETESSAEELLDLTGGDKGGDGLLDVTQQSNLEPEGLDEDLLDVTSKASSEDIEDAVEPEAPVAADDNALDFSLDFDTAAAAEPEEKAPAAQEADSNVLDFESAGAAADEDGVDLDLSVGFENAGEEEKEFSVEDGTADGGLELDIGGDDAGGLEFEGGSKDEGGEFSLEFDTGDVPEDAGGELDLSSELESASEGGLELELDTGNGDAGEVPSLELADEDDADHTVFVPRSAGTQEQTVDDEIATKLDLAKAYVELGDGESARGILDEVMADGNEAQRQQAQELISQLS